MDGLLGVDGVGVVGGGYWSVSGTVSSREREKE